MEPGACILLRSRWRGVVRWCWPHHYVGEWNGQHGIYVQPGSHGKLIRSEPGERYLDYWITDAPPFDYVWDRSHVLRFMREGDAHTVELFWDVRWRFLGWYVNLQAPLVIRDDKFDTTDLALDIWVDPDGSWRWKDEDEFAYAQELGVLDADAAAAVRSEGERVVAQQPWPTGWENWRPPDDWHPLAPPSTPGRLGSNLASIRGHSGTLAQASLLVHRQPLRHSFRMSFAGIFRAWQTKPTARACSTRRGAGLRQRLPAAAEKPAVTVAFGATIVGGSFAGAGSKLGLYVGVPALIATVAIARWIFKNWDY